MTLVKVILVAISLLAAGTRCAEQSIPLLLQEALYTEETEGDIEKAIEQYENVIKLTANDTSTVIRETITKVEFHLGLCYLKQGDEERAIVQFKKVLEQFEGHDKIKNLARNYLQDLNPEFKQEQVLPKFLPSPWRSGEQMHHTLYAENGGEIGTIVFEVYDTTVNNEACYSINKSKIITNNWLPTFSNALISAHNLAPLESYTKIGTDMTWSVSYSGSKINYTSDVRGKKTENITQAKQTVFDDEATLYLLRRVSLAVGYKDSALVFNNMNGMYVKGQLSVESIEDVTTAAGTFTCFRVHVTSSFQGEENFEETIWISNDENRYIVQTKGDNYTMKLKEVKHESPASNIVQDERLEIAVNLPSEYLYYNSLTTWHYESVHHIFSEKTMALSRLKKQKRPKEKSNQEIVNIETSLYKKHHKKYSLRKSETKTKTINGIEVIQHVVDVKENFDPMPVVEYRTYFFTEKYFYCLLFLTHRDHFDQNREEFDSIIEAVTSK